MLILNEFMCSNRGRKKWLSCPKHQRKIDYISISYVLFSSLHMYTHLFLAYTCNKLVYLLVNAIYLLSYLFTLHPNHSFSSSLSSEKGRPPVDIDQPWQCQVAVGLGTSSIKARQGSPVGKRDPKAGSWVRDSPCSCYYKSHMETQLHICSICLSRDALWQSVLITPVPLK